MKKLFIGLSGLFLTGCGMMGGGNTATNTATNSVNITATNMSVNVVNTAANGNANGNANAAKPADNSPTRISFGKGQSNAAENMVLAPGQSKKFVVGAKKDQLLTIDSSAKEAKITMITKGKSTEVSSENGFYSATLDNNGDFVFEVSNPTKKEFKTSVNIAISEEGDD